MTETRRPQKKVTKKSQEAHDALDSKLNEPNKNDLVFRPGNEAEITIQLLAKINNHLVQMNRQLLEMNFYCSFMAPEEHRKSPKG